MISDSDKNKESLPNWKDMIDNMIPPTESEKNEVREAFLDLTKDIRQPYCSCCGIKFAKKDELITAVLFGNNKPSFSHVKFNKEGIAQHDEIRLEHDGSFKLVCIPCQLALLSVDSWLLQNRLNTCTWRPVEGHELNIQEY